MAHKICDLDGTTYPTVVAFARAFGHQGHGDLSFVFSYLCAQCHHQLPAKEPVRSLRDDGTVAYEIVTNCPRCTRTHGWKVDMGEDF